ncbi:hypothetical protein [Halomonas sp. 328]|uniref:hypothetical protein n=1 Tax=Halomonas sp. 328 TaxID=2776704 RepID=UPI0018A75ECA|nr:hypothetical protein [Halomonas sp. 328]MBF8221642.1 hypothetical protein [Halomonas sp. 328]
MAQPPEERRPPPLVADPDASLDPPHRHAVTAPPSPRPWGLRLAVLLLAAGLVGVSALAWEERQLLHAELARLEGQFSNIHARFEGLDPGEALASLSEEQASLAQRLDEQRELLEALQAAREQDPSPQALAEALTRLEEQQATLEAWLTSSRASLDALEALGEEARAGLSERLDSLASQGETARDALSRRVEALEGQETLALASRLEREITALNEEAERSTTRLNALEETLGGLRDTLEPLRGLPDNAREARAALGQRLEGLQAEVRELRRGLLATEARLEMLSP